MDLPDAYLTGFNQIDDEHRALIARIESMAELERAGNKQRLLSLLAQFMSDLAEHFRKEEDLLERLGYPEVSSHAKHHLQTILSLDRLIIGIDHGDTIEPSAAHRCFHEIVKGLLEPDMEFARWAAKHSDSVNLSIPKGQSFLN